MENLGKLAGSLVNLMRNNLSVPEKLFFRNDVFHNVISPQPVGVDLVVSSVSAFLSCRNGLLKRHFFQRRHPGI